MNEEEKGLQNPETWNFDQAVVSPGVQKPRAVVSVAFTRADFERVAGAAQQSGMKTSEFIRGAALAKAKVVTEVTSLGWAGVSLAGIITEAASVPGTSTDTKPRVDDLEVVISR